MKNVFAIFKLLIFYSSFLILTGCSIEKKISKSATQLVLKDSSLTTAHVGISIYEPATNKYWFNYQGDHYFVPASNTKIPTCYAAMKYLGDSLVGLRYDGSNEGINIVGTGDPTFLHPDFKNQSVFDFLKRSGNVNYLLDGTPPGFSPLGNGWAWNDFLGDYAAERSVMPIYGNVVKFYMAADTIAVMPSAFFNSNLLHTNTSLRNRVKPLFRIVRNFESNFFHPLFGFNRSGFSSQSVPFKTISPIDPPGRNQTFLKLLEDTLHKKMGEWGYVDAMPVLKNIIHSQPTDSLLKPMMHRSDNFFAEQSLLMVSNELLGIMSDERIIDTLLKTDFKDLPQKPRWADGSGLSRYNLFTPQDFVAIFNKMKNEFGMDRIKNIFPTGNEGTLNNYYKAESGWLFGKTGSLSGVVALSGFLYTKKNKLLVFSVLVNNHNASATAVRRAVEKFIEGLREKY